MGFLLNNCTFAPLNVTTLQNCNSFDCDHNDLNDFFVNDSIKWSNELLGKSYCFVLDEDPRQIVCAFTVSNDSIKTKLLPNSRGKKVSKDIPREKRLKSYPAVLIGRLGVNKKFRMLEGEEKSTGDQLMDFIKSWFINENNKTGCRFVVVDSYNEHRALRYYTRNDFSPLFSTEEQEKEFTGLDLETELKTRMLFFDLILLTN
ncbi:N-acetyltransferase [Flavobacteriaceae bacterium F89]|uniref:N-acetyltransferase n=1 Tax=Cerina litoralis TaxID=2874477 RepID=A0AAE3EZG1_9FLAO|nr:N-acetyltransferase [Cerina litoralis]MCG2462566.1 N-acetyltransferase [Cerina litoralis]